MSKPHWAVAIQSMSLPFDRELGTAICRCLEELGHAASLVTDGDPAGLEADTLLLLVNLSNFSAYCEQLRKAGTDRPAVVLWQMDPLLPEDTPPEAEVIGLNAARWKDRLRLQRSKAGMSRWDKIRTGYRLRAWAYKQISAPGFRKATHLMQRSAAGGGDFEWRQVRGIMGGWHQIRKAHREHWVDHFIVSIDQRRRFLASRSIPSHFIPVGAYPELGRELGLTRDIQVGFLGAAKYGRRAGLLERLGRELEQKGVPLTRVEAGCYGEERCNWLNRVRILVNLHHQDWSPAWVRFLMAARCGTLMVSEPTSDEHPLKPGVHYVAATADEMPATILKLLAEPATISRITRAAADLCDGDLSLFRAVERITACLEPAIPTIGCAT